KPRVLRASLVAGGVAFSASLVVSSIQHPVRDPELKYPRPGQARSDATAGDNSDVLQADFSRTSRLAAPGVAFMTPAIQEVSRNPEFVEFLRRAFPAILEPRSPSWALRAPDSSAPEAVAPTTFATSPQSVPYGGGGNGIS